MKHATIWWVCLALCAAGCDDDGSSGAGGAGGAPVDLGPGGAGGAGGAGGVGGGVECPAEPGDFPGDAWEACISDGGRYELAGASPPSSIGRVEAFDRIAELLWRGGIPDAGAFIDAQLVFVEDEGLGSRVARRYDSHVPAPDGANCREPATADPYPDYCVGPAQILPIINDAFDAGAMGEDPLVNAARIEAAGLWFLYVSTFKEANTCKGAAKDCDSAWAYFTGGTQRDNALGLAGVIRDLDPQIYEDVFDSLLAVRCWRDLDDGEEATDDALHAQALEQLDTALDRGFALIIIDRALVAAAAEGETQAAADAALRILGHAFERAVRARDPGEADQLRALIDADTLDYDAIATLINAVVPCP